MWLPPDSPPCSPPLTPTESSSDEDSPPTNPKRRRRARPRNHRPRGREDTPMHDDATLPASSSTQASRYSRQSSNNRMDRPLQLSIEGFALESSSPPASCVFRQPSGEAVEGPKHGAQKSIPNPEPAMNAFKSKDTSWCTVNWRVETSTGTHMHRRGPMLIEAEATVALAPIGVAAAPEREQSAMEDADLSLWALMQQLFLEPPPTYPIQNLEHLAGAEPTQGAIDIQLGQPQDTSAATRAKSQDLG